MTTYPATVPSVAEFSVDKTWHSNRQNPTRWILSHIVRHKIQIFLIILGAFGNGIGAGILPLFIGYAFDVIVEEQDLAKLALIAGGLVFSQFIRSILMMGRNLASEVVGQRVERDTRDELYISLIGKSMTFHDRHATGDLMARATNDVREINMLINPGLNLIVGSLNFIITPFILVPTLHPQLLLVPTLYTLIYGVVLWDYMRKLRPATQAVRLEFGRLNATLAEAIDGVETVKGAAQEPKEINRFGEALLKWRDAFVWQGDVEAQFLPLLLLTLTYAAGLLHSLLLFYNNQIGVGDVIAFNGILMMFQFPTFASQFAYSHLATGLSSAERVLELINTETELDQNAGGYAEPISGSLEFKDVTFAYNGTTPTLEKVSFKIKPGQTVAIVGQTGAGKTTITKLINRTYDVNEGEILINGVNVRNWDMEALRRQISIIEQDIYLFPRTVAENIAFGCPGATLEAVVEASKSAQAHDFITTFKDGYDTIVGERGVTLSGGQRQRLALARAFLTNPRILVLDDSTSAIDSATEDKIQRAIEEAARGRTTILITHRLSQIRWADLIIVLRQGCIAMVGDHDTLLSKSEAYRNIFARYN